MSESKVDCDLVLAEYKKSSDIKVVYKYLEFVASFKQDAAVLKIIQDKERFDNIVKHVKTRYHYKAYVLVDLVRAMWMLQNREICIILLENWLVSKSILILQIITKQNTNGICWAT